MKIYYKVITAYIVLLLSIILAIFLTTILKNPIILALLLSIIPLGDYFLYSWVTKDRLLISEDKTSIRYTMHCKNCGWEWMSNTSDKVPSSCPNCKTKDKAEVIGWRKVNISTQKQKEKDLRNFFKFT